MTLNEWLVDYYAPLRNCAARTVELYQGTIDRFEEFLGRVPTLNDFNDITVARFLAARQKQPGLSLATVAKDHAHLAGMWNLAAKRRLVSEFPTLPPIHSPDRIPVAWTIEQMQAIMRSISALKKDVGVYPARIWWRGLIMVIWDTGERINAVMQIKIRDVDMQQRLLRIPAEHRKNKRRDLMFALNLDTIAAISPLWDPEDQERALFPWPSFATHIYWHYNKILRAAGLPTDNRSKFHRIRRSVATYMKVAGGDPTTVLDHSNPAVTRKYIDPRIYRPQYPADVLPSIVPRVDHPAAPEGPHAPPTNADR